MVHFTAGKKTKQNKTKKETPRILSFWETIVTLYRSNNKVSRWLTSGSIYDIYQVILYYYKQSSLNFWPFINVTDAIQTQAGTDSFSVRFDSYWTAVDGCSTTKTKVITKNLKSVCCVTSVVVAMVMLVAAVVVG